MSYAHLKTDGNEMPADTGNEKLLTLNNITMVVKDIAKTSQYLSNLLGIGPWEVMEYAPTPDEVIVGQPFKLRFAFADLGKMTLQLTQPMEGNSPWQTFLDEKGDGLHNFYFEVSDWDETVDRFKREGNTVLASGILEGKRWCLFESTPANLRIEIGES